MYANPQMEYNIKEAASKKKAGKERCLYVLQQVADKFQSSEDKATRRMTDNDKNKDNQDKLDSTLDLITSTAQKKDPRSLKLDIIPPTKEGSFAKGKP